jgi:hypothetical protein
MSKRSTADPASFLTGPAYAIAGMFVLFPIVDVLASVWPVLLGNPQWRYGSVGVGANYLLSGVFGLIALAAIAALRGHSGVLKVLTFLSAIGAILLVVGALGFVLDVLQLRTSVPRDNPRTLWMFDIGAAKASLKYLLAAIVLLWLALAARRAARAAKAAGGDAGAPALIHPA